MGKTERMHLVISTGRNIGKSTTLYLRKHGYWSHFLYAVKFFAHFMLVMVLLYFGALGFAFFEDTHVDISHLESNNSNAAIETDLKKSTAEEMMRNASLFWNLMEKKHNIMANERLREDVNRYINSVRGQVQQPSISSNDDNVHQTHKEMDICLKWFYFTTIATTTIGYGHVTPKTHNGKLFYVFFSLVGIPLMMTLLHSCGAIIAALNSSIYQFIKRKFFRASISLSNELVSMVSTVAMFILFMIFVVAHDHSIMIQIHEEGGEEEEWDWSAIDTMYYWMVTFTTVGFGDSRFSLEVELDHMCELLITRLFGLSLMAAIFESIQKFFKARQRSVVTQARKIGQVIDIRRLINTSAGAAAVSKTDNGVLLLQ